MLNCDQRSRSPSPRGRRRSRKRRHDAVYAPGLGDDVELASRVFTEGCDVAEGAEFRRIVVLFLHGAIDVPKAPHPSAAVVAVEVVTCKDRKARPPVDIAARDGAR